MADALSVLFRTWKCLLRWKTARDRGAPSGARLPDRYFTENGAALFQALIASCRGGTNPIRTFSAQELMEATGNYDEARLLGSGLSLVYGGIHDGRPVAVKRCFVYQLDPRGLFDMFLKEVVSLSQVNHRNVVRLLGCCVETEAPILVYELLPGGTLHQYLLHAAADTSRRFPWEDRLRIALEVADALNYLHTALHEPIVHGRVRSASILLDDCWSAKVGTFGFSEPVPTEEMSAQKGSSSASGSHANPSQEYDFGRHVTQKYDVFCFGRVLIELLTGKMTRTGGYGGNRTISLERFITSTQENLLGSVLDGNILSEANAEQLRACAQVAVRSIAGHEEERPTMKELVQELRRIRRFV